MRTSHLPKKLLILFSVFLLGSFFISACRSKTIATTFQTQEAAQQAAVLVNINKADASELEKLPQVGPVLAEKIIAHRKSYGAFRKPEHLLIIDGVSESRFREFRQFINTE